ARGGGQGARQRGERRARGGDEPGRSRRDAVARARRGRARRRARAPAGGVRAVPGPEGQPERPRPAGRARQHREQDRVCAPGVQRLGNGIQHAARIAAGGALRRRARLRPGAVARIDRIGRGAQGAAGALVGSGVVATPASFFQQQHLARRNSRVMVVLFLLATAAVITAVDVVVAAIYAWQSWSDALSSGPRTFAAGWDVASSVLTVTRGAVETLSRDELQGVIAHEFSHIVNGDMRLNIRMIGVLAGILFIGSIGQFLMRSSRDPDNKGSMQFYL